jgi:GntR family histidine utilization transcriptional repressor
MQCIHRNLEEHTSSMTPPRENMSFRDIKKTVLDRIRDQTWAPDSLLPSETELAEEFSSTRTTVNRALRELAEEGYLERRRKAGTRVLKAPLRQARFAIPLVRDEVSQTGVEYRYSLVERSLAPVPAWLAARLELPAGQDALYLRCMHYAGRAPFQLETRWILTDSIPEALNESFEETGPNEWLVQKVPFTSMELDFMATPADSDAAGFLDARPGDPLFTAERTTWLQGKPVTLARLLFAPGYRMTTRL